MAESNRKNKVWHEQKKRFINPYTFARLSGEVVRREPERGTKTGKITCTLTVKTPLAIPDAEDVTEETIAENKKHLTYKFFRVNGKPVIPGSQLRGMIRSYYEALSNSCFSVNNNNIMSARHGCSRHPGLVRYSDGAWHLYPATMKLKKTSRALMDDEFNRGWYNSTGDKFQSFIFTVNGEEVKCENLEQAVEDYNNNVDIYIAEDKNKDFINKYIDKGKLSREGIKLRHDPSSNIMYPVFYEMAKDNDEKIWVYLSPSQLGRSVFVKRIDDLLGSHKSCSKTDGSCLCKACELFGMISEKGGKSHASRLRFADAELLGENFTSTKAVMLKVLSNPKTTSVEFYTRRPENAAAWTYDCKTTKYKTEKIGTRNATVPDRSFCDVELNGRKFYVHNPMLSKEDYHTDEKSNMSSSMELCNEQSQFSFDIFFENITDEQLNELVWTLTLGENSADSDRMFKLGHGKPLGLGSVKVTVDSVEIRDFDTENLSYSVNTVDPSEFLEENPFDSDSDYFKDLMAIVNFTTLKKPMEKGAVISYPIGEEYGESGQNSQASHQWFTGNRALGDDGTQIKWSIKYVLPRITSKNPTLPALLSIDENKLSEYLAKTEDDNVKKSETRFSGNSGIKIKNKKGK